MLVVSDVVDINVIVAVNVVIRIDNLVNIDNVVGSVNNWSVVLNLRFRRKGNSSWRCILIIIY
jgi:hypothetical protein